MTIHYCYRTTNKITGDFYIGKRTTRRYENWFDDPYLGSGKRLNNAIKKYGKENFHKVILCYAETREENSTNEILFIGELWMQDDCYNLMPGGKGGPTSTGKKYSEEHRRKISESMKGKTKSAKTRKRMSEAKKGKERKPFSEEWRRNLSEGKKGKKRKPHSDETKRKMRESRKAYWAKKKSLPTTRSSGN